MVKIHFFDELPSTQNYLKNNLDSLFKDYPEIKNHIVIAKNQSNGVGRSGNSWTHLKNAIAFSFNLTPHPQSITLTTIEIGVLVAQFFNTQFKEKLFLKWPNDLINSKGEKCGGILVNYHDSQNLISGIGINLFLNLENEEKIVTSFRIKGGALFPKKGPLLSDDFHKHLPIKIADFILSNRINALALLIKEWNALCFHKEKHIVIDDGLKKISGIFLGIGEAGEALIKTEEEEIQKVISGTLSF